MTDMILEAGVKIASTFLITAIGVLGTYFTLRLSQAKGLQNVNAAQQEAIHLAEQTVGELQQTVVEQLKAGHADGKLSREEVAKLGQLLLDKTMEKMSTAAYDILVAASVDISALIAGAGECLICRMKSGDKLRLPPGEPLSA